MIVGVAWLNTIISRVKDELKSNIYFTNFNMKLILGSILYKSIEKH